MFQLPSRRISSLGRLLDTRANPTNRRHSYSVTFTGDIGVYALEESLQLACGSDGHKFDTIIVEDCLDFLARAEFKTIADSFYEQMGGGIE